jgi:hypothetical protein
MKVRVVYEVLNEDLSAFGSAIQTGVKANKTESDAAIRAELDARLANSQTNAAKHQAALNDFDGLPE